MPYVQEVQIGQATLRPLKQPIYDTELLELRMTTASAGHFVELVIIEGGYVSCRFHEPRILAQCPFLFQNPPMGHAVRELYRP